MSSLRCSPVEPLRTLRAVARIPFLLSLFAALCACADEPGGTPGSIPGNTAEPEPSPSAASEPSPAQGAPRTPAPVPPEAEAALARARERYQALDTPGAEAELERVVALAPDWAEGQRALGKLLLTTTSVWVATHTLDRARLEEATRALLRAHELEPGHADGTYWAGRAQVLGARPTEAAQLLSEALRLDPNHALAWKELALLHVASGEIERAKPALVRAAELRPEDDELRFQLGLALEAEGDLAAAIAAHRAALALNPAHEGPRMRLVSLHQRRGETAEADRELSELERWKVFGARLRAAQDAHRAAPRDANTMLALGELMLEAGMRSGARTWFELARQQEPANEQAARRLSELAAQATHTSPPASNEVPR